MAGRPTKYNEERADTICKYIAAGGNREDAAQAAGVGKVTFYAWCKRHPDFRNRVMEAEASSVIVTERAAQKKDPVRWLQAKRPLLWGNLGKQAADDLLEKSLTAVNTLLARIDTAPPNSETADDLDTDPR